MTTFNRTDIVRVIGNVGPNLVILQPVDTDDEYKCLYFCESKGFETKYVRADLLELVTEGEQDAIRTI